MDRQLLPFVFRMSAKAFLNCDFNFKNCFFKKIIGVVVDCCCSHFNSSLFNFISEIQTFVCLFQLHIGNSCKTMRIWRRWYEVQCATSCGSTHMSSTAFARRWPSSETSICSNSNRRSLVRLRIKKNNPPSSSINQQINLSTFFSNCVVNVLYRIAQKCNLRNKQTNKNRLILLLFQNTIVLFTSKHVMHSDSDVH